MARFKRRGVPPFGLLNSFAPDCRRGRKRPSPPVAYATCGGLGCGFVSSRPNGCSGALALDRSRSFRRQEADIGSRCKRATIGGKCIPNFQRDSRKLWGYLLGSGYHVPRDRRIDVINSAGWLAIPAILTQPLHTPEDLASKALIWRIERSFSLSAGHWAGFTSQPNSCKSENREKCGFSLHIRIHKFWNDGGNHMFLCGNFPLVLTIEKPQTRGTTLAAGQRRASPDISRRSVSSRSPVAQGRKRRRKALRTRSSAPSSQR